LTTNLFFIGFKEKQNQTFPSYFPHNILFLVFSFDFFLFIFPQFFFFLMILTRKK
jgi:hypothetical protein